MQSTRAASSPSTLLAMQLPAATTAAAFALGSAPCQAITVTLQRTFGQDLTSPAAWTATLHLPNRADRPACRVGAAAMATSRFATPALIALRDRLAPLRVGELLNPAEYDEARQVADLAIADRCDSRGRDDSELLAFGLAWNRDGAVETVAGKGAPN